MELEEFALGALQYKLKDGVDASELGSDLQWYLSDDYKREVLEQMSTDQLLDVIMTNPTVHLRPSGRDTGARREGCGAARCACRGGVQTPVCVRPSLQV